MWKRLSGKIFLALMGLATLGGLHGGRDAWAGPAKYDPETRSIRFTYTFAALTNGQFGDAAIGAPQKPTSEQDAIVRTVSLKVSDALSKATAGRLKIASLDLASDVKRADIVISLTDKPERGGWAIAGAIEGRPGQIGLYYQTLVAELEQDYVLTATHEVCHYIFGLVDEYNFPSGCPVANPGGPGCLMDNYLTQGTRHGWYGRFCNDDHSSNPAQQQSCQVIVDKFFRDHNVTTNGPADDGAPAQIADASTKLGNRKSKIDNITNATVGLLREKFNAEKKGKKGGADLSAINSFKGEAEKFLTTQLGMNQVSLSADEKKNAVDMILKQTASVVKLAIPPRFDPLVELIANFAKNRAKQLREESPKDSDSTRKRKIVNGLLAFMSGLSGAANAPTVNGTLTAEEKKYLDLIATQAATMTDGKKLNEDLYKAALAHIKLDRETASTILDIAGEVGVVGIENRLAALGEVDADLRPYMPGRTASSGFGRRRTIIIDPDPLDPKKDYVITQSGIHRYTDIRDQNVELFSKLVERARIELLMTDIQKTRLDERRKMLAKPAHERFQDEQIRRLAELTDRNKVRAQREAELRATISELGQQIRRNRLENIVFMIPPGGIPGDISALFEGLRRTLIVQGDVRLDIVMVGPDEIPFALRDIAVGSGGSIYTVADVDEVGALAQRLKNDQSSGAWVILPHQDEISGPRSKLNITKTRQAQKWILNDTRGGKFQGPLIDLPAFDVQSRVDRIIAYFSKPRDPKAMPDQPGSESWSEYELEMAGILSPDAIRALRRTMRDALIGHQRSDLKADETLDQDSTNIGLRGELDILHLAIRNYNDRNPATGSGETMRSAVIEHLIRARGYLQSIKSSLEIGLAAHEKFLAPDYGEDRILQEAYDRFEAAYKIIEARLREQTDLSYLRMEEKELRDLYRDSRFLRTDMYSMLVNTPRTEPKDSKGWGEQARYRLLKVYRQLLFHGPMELAVTINEDDDPIPSDIDSYTNQFDGYFWKNYPDKIRIDLILANFDRKSWALFHPEDLRGEQLSIARSQAAPTIAYIDLRIQEFRLRSVQEFLDHIERDLSVADDVPLSGRIDRRALVLALERLQDAAPGTVELATGRNRPHPMAPVDTVTIENGIEKRKEGTYRLPRFYAENILFDPKKQLQAEFELIVGFAKPLPGIDLSAIRDNRTEVLPDLRLYNDNGQLVNTPSLSLDRDLSTPTCLIYHFAPEFKEEGWYTAALLLKPETYRLIGSDVINFTFSVASTRPNFRLNSAMVQMPNDPELIPPPPNRGLARVMDRRVKVEVQVYGGTSILSAAIRGVLYKLGTGTEAINPIGQTFYDDGKTSGDRTGGDGVYTTLIPLDQIEKGMEYRVLIQAESTENSRNIPPEDPNKNDEKRRKDASDQGVKTIPLDPTEKVVVPAPKDAVIFQRATSIQIRVDR